MALSKLQYFEEISLRLSEFTKALSHPARLEILETIAKRETCICSEIVNKLPLAQSTVSQHLKELKKYGLINSEADGSKSCYTINWKALESSFGMVQGFADKLKKLNGPGI
ncbi:metalloregulator ArsR/SmtB family transcription factor [bacterium]|nr:metalloregulator ArsR/SmtB family transcription factor [bacterium]